MKKSILTLVFVLATLTTFSQSAKKLKEFNLENKVALQGYDPVSYFKQNKAIKGKKEFSSTYDGVIYNFASQADKDLFMKSPASYEPEYGGWCAYAMGNAGEKVEIDPATFKIVDNKLYLFYNAYFNNTLKSWNKDQTNLNKKADLNWKKIIN